MPDEFDELEKQIMESMKKVYTETVIDHAMNPRNTGQIHNADGFASLTGPCRDTMKIWLTVNDGRIVSGTFWTDGCSTTVACGSITTEMIKNEDIAQALAISQSDILKALGGLPEDNRSLRTVSRKRSKSSNSGLYSHQKGAMEKSL